MTDKETTCDCGRVGCASRERPDDPLLLAICFDVQNRNLRERVAKLEAELEMVGQDMVRVMAERDAARGAPKVPNHKRGASPYDLDALARERRNDR